LEIGFGTGHCLVALARAVGPTGKVYGIDLSEGMIEIAQKNLEREGLAQRADWSPPVPDSVILAFHHPSERGCLANSTRQFFVE